MSDVFEQRLNDDDIDSFNISFYYFYDDFPKYDSLSFAYYTVDPYLNLINNLYDNNQIKYKGFGIYLEDLDKSINDKIFLGSFPSKYTLNKQLSKIKIDVPSNSWAIKLNSISFGNSSLIKQSISIEQVAYFQLKVSEFYAPYSFFKELMDFILHNVQNVSCRLNAYYDGEMLCNSSDAFKLIGDLVFHVNNNTDTIVIPNNKLYKCDHERSCFLKMKQMKGDKDIMNYWMFDNQILYLYNGDSGVLVTFKDDPVLYIMVRKDTELNIEEGKKEDKIFKLNGYIYYPLRLLASNEFDLAYAITIHKSQGSDYQNILVILPTKKGHPLLNRQIVYTAITRTKGNTYILSNYDRLVEAKDTILIRDTNII